MEGCESAAVGNPMTQTIVVFVIVLAAVLTPSVYAQATPCTSDLGCWRHNSDDLTQSASVKKNPDGSLAISIGINGGSPGTPATAGTSGGSVTEAARGGGSRGGLDLSGWRS